MVWIYLLQSDSFLALLTAIAVMLATMVTCWFAFMRQDRIWDRQFGDRDDGSLRV
jgi:hypothetical protein